MVARRWRAALCCCHAACTPPWRPTWSNSSSLKCLLSLNSASQRASLMSMRARAAGSVSRLDSSSQTWGGAGGGRRAGVRKCPWREAGKPCRVRRQSRSHGTLARQAPRGAHLPVLLGQAVALPGLHHPPGATGKALERAAAAAPRPGRALQQGEQRQGGVICRHLLRQRHQGAAGGSRLRRQVKAADTSVPFCSLTPVHSAQAPQLTMRASTLSDSLGAWSVT